MISRWRGVAVGGALLLTGVGWCAGSGAGGAGAQIPIVPGPPDSTTVPTTPAPPPEEPEPVPDPSKPPAPPSTVPDPSAQPPPVTTAPQPAATTTTVPSSTGGVPGPARLISSSRQAQLSLDLSEIDALRRQARGKGPRPAEPDFGFDSGLPFAATGLAAQQSAEDAVELGADAEEWARVRSLAAFAAGLVVLVLVGIVMWMLRQARPSLSSTPAS